jgi:hypothetical protein
MIIHFGSVWPLFTEWATLGEYRYHRPVPAYSNLRSNSLLALDGALGHVTEVLSGDYYQALSTSSPHQIWSSAMVVSSLLRGLLGLETDATSHQLTFAPVQFRDDGCLTSTDGKSAATDMIQKLPLTGLIAALAAVMMPRMLYVSASQPYGDPTTADASGYVGIATCAKCHAAIHESYTRFQSSFG